MSSLQLALAPEQQKHRQTSCTSAGQFESCFAQGLDLSEFDTPHHGNNNGNRQTASAELLRIKEQEMRRNEMEEQEEYHLEQAVKDRQQQLLETQQQQEEANEKKTTERDKFSLESILRKMHNADARGGNREQGPQSRMTPTKFSGPSSLSSSVNSGALSKRTATSSKGSAKHKATKTSLQQTRRNTSGHGVTKTSGSTNKKHFVKISRKSKF